VQPGQANTNKDRLSDEIGDVLAMIEKAVDADLINSEKVYAAIKTKKAKLAKYMQTSPEGGHS